MEIWLKEGGRNMGYFQRMAHKREKNSSLKIKINVVWLTEEAKIQHGVSSTFKNLLSDLGDWHPNPFVLDFARLDRVEVADWKTCLLGRSLLLY